VLLYSPSKKFFLRCVNIQIVRNQKKYKAGIAPAVISFIRIFVKNFQCFEMNQGGRKHIYERYKRSELGDSINLHFRFRTEGGATAETLN
jgi:hypothetical protein